MKNKLYIGTNTKMYKTIAQTAEYLEELGKQIKTVDREKIELFVIPSFTALESAGRRACDYGIRIGGQNMAWEDEGQYTGEISPAMLKEAGATIAEIGHSERRHVLGESDEMENRKVHAAVRHGMTALLCVGETGLQKEHGVADETLRIQIKEGLYGIKPEDASSIWIAYEPVWAIGTGGQPASAEYACERHRVIRDTLFEHFGDAAYTIPLLYGGSVNMQNAEKLISVPDIDGLFIGRSAWDAAQFGEIIRKVLAAFLRKHS
ncbi:triose-phosphate isomerase [Ruminococcus gauvreauii]|uniref:Triosephosphate isomerase n=1 Tax=Ruminococcus gauvreauii TaxID=438033 RepID=A0ABY5VHF9_9FIRM|nr:triose-phosphate isomerase [Ruminococcus gauvreauii]UWP59391.1 triose-phosphate isomerase [Ruminococcus gauvreauii]